MLKALELQGFKSFADKTRLDFPDGITVVVGPNGSGKSNIVDGIKWVLGEQSAKSLRGTEMADVIFKGSGNGQRRPSNTAEVTIVFDNQLGRLDIDGDEVRVTRRVYRSGEGEYLINAEPCRLRDIRDLFRGTGVGSDAYSLIEQGKVDTLLQASPRERRAIFEEAAGISRFRAKKVESQRRLDRVEQNLLRLSDIVEEVERRLKSLRNQATKARRYREYSDRLKELRTHVGLTDFRNLSQQRVTLDAELAALATQIALHQSASAEAEQTVAGYDSRMTNMTDEARELRQTLAVLREAITSRESTTQLQRQTLLQLEKERALCRKKVIAVNSRAGDMQQQLSQVDDELVQVEQQYAEMLAEAEAEETRLTRVREELSTRQQAVAQQRTKHGEQLQATSKLQSELASLESELNLAQNAIQRDQQQDVKLQEQLASAQGQCTTAEAKEAELKQSIDEAARKQTQDQQALDAAAARLTQLLEEQSKCQQQLTAATERSNVLEEVERRLEGIGAGTKDLLGQAKTQPIGPLSEIQGMVADLIEVKVEMAPLVDAALGDRAQYIVVTGQRLIRAVSDGSQRLRGRVGMISVAMLDSTHYALDPQISQEQQVIGHATNFVQVDAPWRPLARHLLGTTWFVSSIEAALLLREKYNHNRPWRYVTPSAEVLEADGTLFGGPRLASGGLVARRSELRSLRTQLKRYREEESVLKQKCSDARTERDDAEAKLRSGTDRLQRHSEQYAQAHAEAESARRMVAQCQQTQESLQDELVQLQSTYDSLSSQKASAAGGLSQLETLVSSLEAALDAMHTELGAVEKEQKQREQQSTTTKIDLAKIEQRVETLRMEKLRCQQDSNERANAMSEIQSQLQQCNTRYDDTARAILSATSELAELYLQQETCEQNLRVFRHDEDQIASQRMQQSTQAHLARQKLQAAEKQQNAIQLRLGELRMKQDAVSERVREDYGLELAEIEAELENQGERATIDQEINELRRKINNIGAVNMESLEELDDLEQRFGSLSSQYNDLVSAKESLEQIIQRINVDSRRMFTDTMDLIRTNFQALFRRAFGGGHADIVIEEDADVLEAGIDIVATPPGKHSLNISLLSGGERALTAVTLLLAIFRHRPSPFCILDEVDGPLDEANIGRFVDVLREFLETTKVVIVTHSKKTMSAASTLYGITMQESGVSKRVSVQFNDVADDGTILKNTDDDAA